MSLTLDPQSSNPYADIIDGLAAKIANPDLSFVKELVAQGLISDETELNIFDQTVEEDRRHAYDPPLSLCPAVTILTSGYPPVADRGIGTEIWHFDVAVMLKLELPDRDSRKGLRAYWELTRTVLAGNKTPQLDPLAQTVGPKLADYQIADDMAPPTSSERDGFRVARGMFIVQFRYSDNVRG